MNKSNKTAVKKITRGLITVAVIMGISVTAETVEKVNCSITTNRKITSIIMDNIEDGVLTLPSSNESSREREIICSGKRFIEEVKKKGIDYIIFGGRIYTSDGRDMAKIHVRVRHVENDESTPRYEYFSVYREISPDGKYEILSNENTDVLKIISIRIIKTIPFSILEEMDLNEVTHGEEESITYALTPRF